MPVAPDARVLVVECSEKQKSVVRIPFELRGKLQGESQEGELARSKPPFR